MVSTNADDCLPLGPRGYRRATARPPDRRRAARCRAAARVSRWGHAYHQRGGHGPVRRHRGAPAADRPGHGARRPPAASRPGQRAGHGPGRGARGEHAGPGAAGPGAAGGGAGGRGGRGHRRPARARAARARSRPSPSSPGGPGGAGGRDPGGRDRLDHVDGQPFPLRPGLVGHPGRVHRVPAAAARRGRQPARGAHRVRARGAAPGRGPAGPGLQVRPGRDRLPQALPGYPSGRPG